MGKLLGMIPNFCDSSVEPWDRVNAPKGHLNLHPLGRK